MSAGSWKALSSDRRPADAQIQGRLHPASRKDDYGGSRVRVLEFITAHPGVHLREVCRGLGLAMGDVQYNVNRLEKDGKITSARRGFYRFFYPATLFATKQRDVLGVLSLDTPRELLLAILGNPNSSQEELSKIVGVSQPTASWHLRRLSDLGVVKKQQRGRAAVYQLVGASPEEVASFLKSYHPSVWERWSGRLAEIFISYSSEEAPDRE